MLARWRIDLPATSVHSEWRNSLKVLGGGVAQDAQSGWHAKAILRLLENAYFACLCLDLTKASVRFEPQKALPLLYDGVRIDCAYRVDLIVEELVVVEAKALDVLAPVYLRRLRTYTRLADCPVGLLLNFGAPVMKEGIKRVINGFPER